MATATQTASDPVTQLIDSIERGEHAALEAVQRFVEAVDEALPVPAVGESAPRRRIIDAAFRMTDELIGTSNELARSLLRSGERGVEPSAPRKAAPKS